MEHPSHKICVADMTIAGRYCAQRKFTGRKVSKILVYIVAYFYHLCHCGLACRQTHMVPCVARIILMHVDFCYVSSVCTSSKPCVIYLRASSFPKVLLYNLCACVCMFIFIRPLYFLYDCKDETIMVMKNTL